MKKLEREKLRLLIEQDFELLVWRQIHEQPKQYSWGWVYSSDGIYQFAPTRLGAIRKWRAAMRKHQSFLKMQASVNAAAQTKAGPWIMADKSYKHQSSELTKTIVVVN